MANRFVSPEQQFINGAGQPYAGGFLYFYVSGTSTPANTYSNQALSIANANPVVLDAAGNAGNIFLDPSITYKVVLTDANNNQIWTFDPVIPTDSASSTGFFPVVSCTAAGTNTITLTPITPSQQPSVYNNYQLFSFVPAANSSGAVTARVGTLPSLPVFVAPGVQAGAGTFLTTGGPYFLAYGSLVGGASAGFLLINENLQAIQSSLPLPTPQGYLTPVSGTPVISSDALAATVIYYTPFLGLGALVHNGSSIVSTILSGELSLTLTSSQAANNIYDIFLAYNGGTPVIGTGPSWSAGTGGSVTAGSCARGTGAGGTALVRTQGVWTNAASMSLVTNIGGGNVSLSIPANQGIYLGSIFVDGVAGQVTCHRSYGQSRKFGIWNAFNRVPIILQAGDSTASWQYNTTNTPRPSNNNSANNLTTFTGLAEEEADLSFVQQAAITSSFSNSGFSGEAAIGIGVNSSTTLNGLVGDYAAGFVNTTSGTATYKGMMVAQNILSPSLGINTAYAVEDTKSSTAATITYNGTNGNMLLKAKYRG